MIDVSKHKASQLATRIADEIVMSVPTLGFAHGVVDADIPLKTLREEYSQWLRYIIDREIDATNELN